MPNCKKCGDQIRGTSTFCKQCELKICKEYVEDIKPRSEIAEKYKVTGNTITNILKRNGFKLRTHSEANKLSWTPERRKLISVTHKGKVVSKETRKKMSIWQKGPNNPNWKGGVKVKPYTWRFAVKLRDNFCCQECYIDEFESRLKYNGRGLDTHHIDGDRTNNRIENGITLCVSCHARLHGLKRRTKNAKKKST